MRWQTLSWIETDKDPEQAGSLTKQLCVRLDMSFLKLRTDPVPREELLSAIEGETELQAFAEWVERNVVSDADLLLHSLN